jgi:monovalent cation/hydrogen antiporter
MQGLHQLETIIVLLTAVLLLTTLAQRLVIPYPILLVIGGLGIALVPGLPIVRLDPDLIFLVFLPPILWAAAYFTSLREFRQNLRPISLLAVGLVLATTAAVATVARLVLPGMGWPEAIALGAIVSPPDAVAATSIVRRLRVPRRIITILEGESLVNDATALILYRAAIAAVVTGGFALGQSLLHFVIAAVGGVAIGIAVGFLAGWIIGRMADPFSEIATTLLAPYIAWVLAENIHASAVLACVAGGLYLRQWAPSVLKPTTRLQARAVWDVLVFVLNGVIFILLGLQLAALREAVSPGNLVRVLVAGIAVSVTAVVVRLIWVPLAAIIPRALSSSLRKRDPMPAWSAIFLIGWSGMRGIVTLAAALALPFTTAAGTPFPFRAEIILMSFGVILVTLVVQGLSLRPLIRMLRMDEDRALEQEEMLARERAAAAALARLDQLAGDGGDAGSGMAREQLERLKEYYSQRLQRFGSTDVDPECTKEAAESSRQLRHEAIDAERETVIDLRNDGTISDEVLHRLEQELDLEALRLGLGDERHDKHGLRRASRRRS